MKIYIASDHGGFKLKEKVVQYIEKLGHTAIDLGPEKLDPKDDYPDYVVPLAKKVGKGKSLGIVLCRNGQGVCIATNKVHGVRAVTGFSKKMIASTREDDSANVVCIPADYLFWPEIKRIIKTFIDTPFSGSPRHKRRLKKVRQLEK
jgi:ribose 5-phosphate isomerase B